MSIKISELPVASSVNSADIVPIVQDGTTKQAQAEMFKPQIETVINSSSTNNKPVGAKAVYDYSAPIKHDSETQEYGVATTTKYGHTKIIDSLGSSSYQVGESLSAYQGAVLKQSIDSINDDIGSITDELATKQTISNMTNKLDENSTETQYPNAQVTYEKYNELLNQIPTNEVSGNPINVQDSSNLPIKDFAMSGNATQADTPTPDYPQDIHVVTGDNTVKIQGKNLLKLDTIPASNFNTTTYTSIGNIIEIKNGNGGIGRTQEVGTNYIKETKTNSWDWSQRVKFKNLKPNTQYKLSCKVETNIDSGTINIMGYTKQYNETTFAETITTNSDGEAERFPHLYTSASQASGKYVYLTNIQLEEGTTQTEYETPVEQTQLLSLPFELAKIGDYADRIYKQDGKWYVEKNIANKTLNGTENWQSASSVASGTTRFYYEYNNDLKALWDICLISDHFVATTWGAIYQTDTTSKNLIATNDSTTNRRFVIRIDNNYASTVEGFKTWLGNNNTLVYYILKTPTTTEITDQTLLGQLEELLKKRTNKNVTNISIVPTGTNAEPTAEVEYRVDLGTVIGNISNAIISLGGNV